MARDPCWSQEARAKPPAARNGIEPTRRAMRRPLAANAQMRFQMKSMIPVVLGLLGLSACATDGTNMAATGGADPVVSDSGAATVPGDAGKVDTAGAPSSAAEAATVDGNGAVAETGGAGASVPGEKPGTASPANMQDSAGVPGKPAAPVPVHTSKPAAPVDVICTPAADAIRLGITFLGSARDVRIDVWGTDGLRVLGETRPVHAATYERGAALDLTVSYEAPDDARSYLGVRVSGRFGERQLGIVRSCTVHPEFPDRDNADADIRVDERGQTIRVIHSD